MAARHVLHWAMVACSTITYGGYAGASRGAAQRAAGATVSANDSSVVRLAVSTAAHRRSNVQAPGQHLRWSTTYDTFFPDSRGWINMGLSIYSEMWPGGCSDGGTGPGGCGLQAKLAAWTQFGIPSFFDLCDHPCQQSTCPNITNASSPWGEFGSCPIWRKGDGLLPGWEAALETQVAQQIKPHFGSGKVRKRHFLSHLYI